MSDDTVMLGAALHYGLIDEAEYQRRIARLVGAGVLAAEFARERDPDAKVIVPIRVDGGGAA